MRLLSRYGGDLEKSQNQRPSSLDVIDFSKIPTIQLFVDRGINEPVYSNAVIQSCTDLSKSNWVDSVDFSLTNQVTEVFAPATNSSCFYRSFLYYGQRPLKR